MFNLFICSTCSHLEQMNAMNATKRSMYQLEKYKGISTRHECPQCHDKHSFALYIDEDGNPIDPSCGRCNHESGCGYHYTPSQYFTDHPSNGKPMKFQPVMQHRPQPAAPKPIRTIESGYLLKSLYAYQTARYWNYFDLFLRSLFNEETIINLHRLYFIGATNSTDREAIIFWQVDGNGRPRAGKIIKYGRDGHRNKATNVNWLHSELKKRKALSNDWELNQCLFGEHLLSVFPDKPVALVEAEKTAIIGAGFFPKLVWVATGGKSQLSTDKLKALAGRYVIAFPDIDGTQEWGEKLRASQVPFRKISISTILERNANAEEREKKIDIADWLVRCKREGAIKTPTNQFHLDWLFDENGDWKPVEQPKTDFELLCENPLVASLVNELNLQPDERAI